MLSTEVFQTRNAKLIVAAILLFTLVLVLTAGPARAIPDPCDIDCPPPPENNPPTVAANQPSVAVNEGQAATNAGTFSDADGDTVTLSASSGTVTKNIANGTWSWSFNASDGPDQSQTVTITANDGTDTVTTTFSLTVNNVAPTVNLSNSFPSVQEGGSYSKGYSSYGYNLSVSDPGNDTWTVNTGCGANGSEWVESNTTVWCGFFDGPGSSVVSATATDSDGATGNTSSVLVNVTNGNPWAVLNAPTSINEGTPATISLTNGAFVSPQDGEADTNAGFRYAFDCNGGALTTATYANSSTSNSTTCPTTDNGTKTVRAKIMDKDGGSNEYTKSITGNNVAPTATFSAPTAVNQGNNFTLSLSGVSDPSSADILTYAFDCGDGLGYVSSATPSKTCNALDKPALTVKGKVMDDDGGSNEYTKSITVNNVFPTGTIKINGGAPGTNNAAVNLTLSSQDPLPGSDIGEMRFRNENTATWSTWQPYATSRAWQLSSGDGTKTVFVEYKDNAGNVSQDTISDQILLDTTDFTAPTVLKWTPTGRRVAPTANVIATFSEAMYKASVEKSGTFTLVKKGTTRPVGATVTYSEPTTSTGTTYRAVLNPTTNLRAGATYVAKLTPAATDAVGNPLVAKTWTFTVKG